MYALTLTLPNTFQDVNNGTMYITHGNVLLEFSSAQGLLKWAFDPSIFLTTKSCGLAVFGAMDTLSAESQKGVNAVQQCFLENQKSAIAIDFVQR